MNLTNGEDWDVEPYDIDETETIQIEEFDLTSQPNDFNVNTIFDFIQNGAVVIPGFQRNYVWDLRRASKLIESLIIGLPVPQVFLYESDRNKWLVIDGQQRLMTIYYFILGRFPRPEGRVAIRQAVDAAGVASVPPKLLNDDAYFKKFNLSLPEFDASKPNGLHGLNYETLGSAKTTFELRTIRNVIVKQVKPSDDDSSMYEMFNRLNTQGVKLTPQEIRGSLYHSDFYTELSRINLDGRWRAVLGQAQPDIHMRDVEILLRATALWQRGDAYTPSMVRFLNAYSKTAGALAREELDEVLAGIERFLHATTEVPRDLFLNRQRRFSRLVFETVFVAIADASKKHANWIVDPESIKTLVASDEYKANTLKQTTGTSFVQGRLAAGRKYIKRQRRR